MLQLLALIPKKRALSLFLAIVMVLTVLPVTNASAANVNTGVTGLSAESSEVGKWSYSDGTINGSVKAEEKTSCGSTSYTAQTSTLTFTNSSGGVRMLSFDYSINESGGSISIDETAVTAGGSFSKKLEAGETVVVSLTSNASNDTETTIAISNMKLVEEKDITITFKAPINGSYTVDGEAITADTTKTVKTTDILALAATANSSYKLLGWYNVTTDGCLSTSASVSLSFADDTVVEPRFIGSSIPLFKVGEKVCTDLNEAISYAGSSGAATIVLISNGTLPAGNYTIPNGKTLLMPMDEGYTVVKNEPAVIYGSHKTPSTYSLLTMANGANITVANGGALCCAGNLCSTGQLGGWNGCPSGPGGRIKMNTGSTITVQSGGKLYAWGYIYGSGSVEVMSGATVYEAFQIKDWRGGTATSNCYSYTFIISQYYIQNIEVPMKLHAGCTEKLYSSANASSSAYPMGATFVGSGGMFNIDSGYLIKDYIENTDRLQIDCYGNVSVTTMQLTGLPMIGSISTEDYELPITSNITLNLHSGTATTEQNIKLLPGVELNVDEGAALVVDSGKKVYVYDNDDWGNFTGSARLYVIGYSVANGTTAKRNANSLVDAKIDLNGSLDVKGNLYTSLGHAAIVSSAGTGSVILTKAPGTADSTIYEMEGNSTKTGVTFNPAYLQHSDGSYYATAGKPAGTEIPYFNGEWDGTPAQTYTVKFWLDHDQQEPLQTVEAEEGQQPVFSGETPTKAQTAQYTYSFDGWTTEGDDTVYTAETLPAATADVSYYAHFAETVRTYAVTWKVDGQEDETVQVPYGETPVYHNGTNPVKAPSDGYEYSFDRWDPAVVSVTGDAEYTALFTRKLESGFYLIGTRNEWSEDQLTPAEKFEKNNDVEYKLTTALSVGEQFKVVYYDNGNLTWYPGGDNYVVDAGHAGDVKAVYFRPDHGGGSDWHEGTIFVHLNQYTITWKNDDGSVIDTTTVDHGTVPTHADASKESTDAYIYTFIGWDPTPVEAVADAEYTAVFDAATRQYVILFVNENGDVLQSDPVDYGAHPVYSGATPSKEGSAQYAYTFAGWKDANDVTYAPDAELPAVEGEATYTAVFTESTRSYTVTFQNWDGEFLGAVTVEYGQRPVYDGQTPTRDPDAGYSYVFAGWKDADNNEYLDGAELPEIIGDTTFTAYYTQTAQKYLVTFQNWDGFLLQSEEIDFGDYPVYDGETPTKPEDEDYTYSFSGWKDQNGNEYAAEQLPAVNGETVYTAQFTPVSKLVDGYYVVGTINGWTAKPAYRLTKDGDLYSLPDVTFAQGDEIKVAYYSNGNLGPWFPDGGDNNYVIGADLAGVPVTVLFMTSYQSGWYNAQPLGSGFILLDVQKYTVRWLNYDNTLIYDEVVVWGKTPVYEGDTPVKPNDEEHSYVFNGWDPEPAPIYEDTDYVAQFTATEILYYITWIVEGESVQEQYPYGVTPVYPNGTPEKEADLQYTYTFAGWDPEVTTVTGNATYTAQFTASPRTYTVTWIVDDQTQTEQYEYGETPVYKIDGEAADPIKEADAQYTYVFDHWDPQIADVTGDATYTAVFSATLNSYTITWVIGDSTETEDYEYGAMPHHDDPTKEADEQHNYTFAGWDPEVTTVTGNATYTAQFTASPRTYTVTWIVDDQTQTEEYEYGATPVYKIDGEAADPVKEADAQYTYVFDHWEPTIVPVTGDATYTAVFSATLNSYTITWVIGDSTETEEYEYGTTPYHADPANYDDQDHSYKFTGWSPAIAAVTGDATYTAQFDEYALNGYYLIGMNNVWDYSGIVPEYRFTVNPNDENEFMLSEVSLTVGDGLKVVYVEYGELKTFYPGGMGDEYHVDAAHAGVHTIFFRPAGNGAWSAFGGYMYIDENVYTVTWIVDGVETTEEYSYGATPVYKIDGQEAIPVKASTEQYSYTFAGWEPEIDAVTEDVTYTAVFTESLNKYNITWKNDDGTVIEITEVEYGNVPTHEAPFKQNTDQFTYTFIGWDPEPVAATCDAEYTAVFSETVNEYEIIFQNYDGTELQKTNVEYGTMPSYLGTEPLRPSTAEFSYSFSGWTPELTTVTGPATYTAVFEETKNSYYITWKNWDGGTFYTELVEYGETPVYNGNAPTKDSDTQYDYTFAGWTPEIVAVTGDAEYTATFTATPRMYDIVWVVEGQEDVHSSWAYGSTPVYMVNGEPATPTKASDDQYSYVFAGWNPEIHSVDGEETYIATFTATTRVYTVTWNVEGVITQETYEYGEIPVYKVNGEPATPSKAATAQYYYNFTGWDPQIDIVSADVTYVAQFEQMTQSYPVIFEDEEGNELCVKLYDYGETPVYEGPEINDYDDDYYNYYFIGWKDKETEVLYSDALPAVTGETRYVVAWQKSLKDGYYVIGPDWVIEDIDPTMKFVENPANDGEYVLRDVVLSENDAMKVVEVYNGQISNWYPEGQDNEYHVEAAYADRNVTIYFRPDGANVNNSAWAHFGGYIFIAKEGYEVKFVNDDGAEIETLTLSYNEVPICSVTPTKPSTTEKDFTFAGWKDAEGNEYPVGTDLPPVIDNVTYTAYYTESARMYTIQFVLDPNNGEVFLDETFTGEMELAYGTEITEWPLAYREGYVFQGWTLGTKTIYNDGMPYTVTGDATFYGVFTVTTYTVVWKNWDGEILETDEDVPYGDMPSYNGTEPTRDPDLTHFYSFAGWTPELDVVTDDVEYTACYDEATRYYTVTWIVDGESTETSWEYGQTPSFGSTPIKDADAQYTYSFSHWTPDVVAVTQDASYTAVFTATLNKYNIRFFNEDGELLYEDLVEYGTVPVYGGPTPTKEADEQYTYEFFGWEPELHEVNGDQDYYATFTTSTNTYTVTWNNYDGSLLYEQTDVPYGTMPVYPGAENPQKPSDAQYNYIFEGWTPRLVMVTGNATYTATYSGTLRAYYIAFLNYDGTVLQEGYYAYGETPSYVGLTPERAGDAQYSYTFAGWTPDIAVVEEDATYTATYTATVNEYKIRFLDEDGTVLQETDVAYGEMPQFTGTDPVKASDGYYSYSFAGWTPEPTEVTGPADYTARYTATPLIEEGFYLVGSMNNWTASEDWKFIVNEGSNGEWMLQNVDIPAGAEIKVKQYSNGTITWYPGDNNYTPGNDRTGRVNVYFNPSGNNDWDSGGCHYIWIEPVLYTVTWVIDGVEETEHYKYLETPSHVDPVKQGDAQYSYTFTGWTPEIVPVTDDATYTAQFSQTVNKYTITWVIDGVETTEEYEYGATPYHVDPVKEADAQYSYTFTGWNPEIATVTADATYTAQFSETVNKYTITWVIDGEEETEEYEYGATPTHADPVKDATAQYTYAFTGWDPEIATVTGDATYTAQFSQTVNEYTITWNNEDGTLIDTTTVAYGTLPTHDEPTKAETARFTYAFAGWSPELVEVTGDAMYTATFNATGKNGLCIEGEDTYWIENGVNVPFPGLIRIVLDSGEINYYYFGEDDKAVKDGHYKVEKNNDLPLPAGINYTFDENGVIVHDPDTSKNGICAPTVDDGNLYYMIDGVKVARGLIQIDNAYYYARTSSGAIVRSQTYNVVVTNGLPITPGYYSFDADGKMILTGFVTYGGATYYYEDGVMAKGFTKIDDDYYFFNAANGKMYKSIQLWVGTNEYGVLPAYYYFGDDGKMETTGFVTSGGYTYYLINGERAKGFTKIGDDYYFFNAGNGRMYKDITLWVGDNDYGFDHAMYYFGEDGKMVIPDLENGVRAIVTDANGNMYFTIDGRRMTSGLYELDGDYYYAQSNGVLVANGSAWVGANDFVPNGWYAFGDDAKMLYTGFVTDNEGNTYYYEDLTLAKGFTKIGEDYYFFNASSGKMYKNKSLWVSGSNPYGVAAGTYEFGEDGRMVNPN